MNRYRQGYLAELQLVRTLKQSKDYHTVLRSAGSRSAIDVVAIGETRILMCQVKTGKGSFKKELEKLGSLPVPRCARKEIRIYRRGKWIIVPVG